MFFNIPSSDDKVRSVSHLSVVNQVFDQIFACTVDLMIDIPRLSSSSVTKVIRIANATFKTLMIVCILVTEFFNHLMRLCTTPYNRLLRRQITASTTDQGKFFGKRVGEVFLFDKINKRICGLHLMMENIFNVWRYCSSNLTLFQVQISFLSARQNLRFKKIA